MIIRKYISIIVLLLLMPSIAGVPLLVHHCCGELESISIGMNEDDEIESCCEQELQTLAYTNTACCQDETVFETLVQDLLPVLQNIEIISPLSAVIHSMQLLLLEQNLHNQSSLLSSRLLCIENNESPPSLLCIFRI